MSRFFKYHFTGQKDGEMIMLVLRRHWFNMLVQFVPTIIVGIILWESYVYLPTFVPMLNDGIMQEFFLFIASLLGMFLAVAFFLIFVDYFLDAWIITDRRVVNIEQRGLFCRVISELELSRIQDITTEVTGIIPTFFNYGEVFVQTAAEKERFVFRKIPDPYKTKDLLMALQKEKQKKKDAELGKLLEEKMS